MAALVAKEMFVVGLGTSLMNGILCTPDRQWPEELVRQLRASPNVKGSVKFCNMGKGSATSAYAVTRIAEIVGLKPDVLLLESYAVNDCAIGPVSLATAAANLNNIIDSVQAGSPNTRIVVMTMSREAASDVNRTQQSTYEAQALSIATAQDIDSIDNYADWPNLTAAMTWNGDMLHPRWRASPDGPAFDTYSFSNILAWFEAFAQEFWS